MKNHFIAVSIALAVSPSVLATDYQGKSLDGRVLACNALTLSVQEQPIKDPSVITLVGQTKTMELLYWALDCSKSLGR
jgi:hypothetical protein